jgi:suppressor for copper-sensitivity B
VRLITPYQTAPRSGELQLGLHFTLSPGWHVYWKNSGDAGFPPVVTVREPALAEATEAEILWPAPKRFELPGDLVAFGYEDEVVYPLRVTLPAVDSDSRPVGVEVDYLVCEVDCIPYRYTLTLAQPVGDSAQPDPETAPLLERWAGQVAVPAEQLVGVSTDGALVESPAGLALEVRVRGVEGDPAAAGLFLESQDAFATGRPEARAEGDGLVFRMPLSPREVNKPIPEKVAFAWTATGLRHENRPVSLEARREVGLRTGPAPSAPETGTPAAGFPKTLLFAFLGGLLLNLMPMVLALLVPELLALRQEPERGRRNAGAAALGILLACWGTASLAGTQLQEPVTAAVLAVAAALLALNLWGFLELPLAPLAPVAAAAGTGRHLLAGLWTPLLAMIGMIGIIPPLTAPSGFAAATALGLGLALPYLVLAAVPGAVRALPAPGAWVAPLRVVLGFAAGAGTLWVLYGLARQVSTEGLAAIELGLLTIALLAWLRHRSARRVGVRFSLAVGLAVCAVALPWLADRNRLSPRPGAAGAIAASATIHGAGPENLS